MEHGCCRSAGALGLVDAVKKNIRIDELAEQLEVSRRTVERWVKNGEVDSFKIGGTRFIPVDSVGKKNDNVRQFPTDSDIS